MEGVIIGLCCIAFGYAIMHIPYIISKYTGSRNQKEDI